MKEAGVEIGVRERNNRRQNSKEMSNEDYSPETKHSKEDDKHCYTNASTDEQDGILLSHSIFRFLFNRINYTKQKRNNTELKQKPDIKMESLGFIMGFLFKLVIMDLILNLHLTNVATTLNHHRIIND